MYTNNVDGSAVDTSAVQLSKAKQRILAQTGSQMATQNLVSSVVADVAREASQSGLPVSIYDLTSSLYKDNHLTIKPVAEATQPHMQIRAAQIDAVQPSKTDSFSALTTDQMNAMNTYYRNY